MFKRTVQFIESKLPEINKGNLKSWYVFDAYHGIDLNSLYFQLNDRNIKTAIFPVAYESCRRVLENGEVEFHDIFDYIPSLLNVSRGLNVGKAEYSSKTNFEAMNYYDVIIIDRLNDLGIRGYEFLKQLLAIHLPNTMVIYMYDTVDIDPEMAMITEDGELLRVDFTMVKNVKKNEGYLSEMCHYANKIRNGEIEILERNRKSFTIKAVKRHEYLKTFDISKYNENDVIVTSTESLRDFTQLIRDYMGYEEITPYKGERIIAYNYFFTFNDEKPNKVIRKGTPMLITRVFGNGIYEVEVNKEKHKIIVDENIFYNILSNGIRRSLDVSVGHVFYMYVITSRLFNSVSFRNVFAFIDISFSTAYYYSLLKMCRKKINIEYCADIKMCFD